MDIQVPKPDKDGRYICTCGAKSIDPASYWAHLAVSILHNIGPEDRAKFRQRSLETKKQQPMPAPAATPVEAKATPSAGNDVIEAKLPQGATANECFCGRSYSSTYGVWFHLAHDKSHKFTDAERAAFAKQGMKLAGLKQQATITISSDDDSASIVTASPGPNGQCKCTCGKTFKTPISLWQHLGSHTVHKNLGDGLRERLLVQGQVGCTLDSIRKGAVPNMTFAFAEAGGMYHCICNLSFPLKSAFYHHFAATPHHRDLPVRFIDDCQKLAIETCKLEKQITPEPTNGVPLPTSTKTQSAGVTAKAPASVEPPTTTVKLPIDLPNVAPLDTYRVLAQTTTATSSKIAPKPPCTPLLVHASKPLTPTLNKGIFYCDCGQCFTPNYIFWIHRGTDPVHAWLRPQNKRNALRKAIAVMETLTPDRLQGPTLQQVQEELDKVQNNEAVSAYLGMEDRRKWIKQRAEQRRAEEDMVSSDAKVADDGPKKATAIIKCQTQRLQKERAELVTRLRSVCAGILTLDTEINRNKQVETRSRLMEEAEETPDAGVLLENKPIKLGPQGTRKRRRVRQAMDVLISEVLCLENKKSAGGALVLPVSKDQKPSGGKIKVPVASRFMSKEEQLKCVLLDISYTEDSEDEDEDQDEDQDEEAEDSDGWVTELRVGSKRWDECSNACGWCGDC